MRQRQTATVGDDARDQVKTYNDDQDRDATPKNIAKRSGNDAQRLRDRCRQPTGTGGSQLSQDVWNQQIKDKKHHHDDDRPDEKRFEPFQRKTCQHHGCSSISSILTLYRCHALGALPSLNSSNGATMVISDSTLPTSSFTVM